MSNTDAKRKILLQWYHSIVIEILSLLIAATLFLSVTAIYYFKNTTILDNLLLPTVLAILTIVVMTPFMGGLRYEIIQDTLIIRSGLLRLTIKTIPLDRIVDMEPSTYNVFKSMACGWYNIFPDGTMGYVRGFKGKALRISTINEIYLIASKNPEQLMKKIQSQRSL